MSKGFDHWLEAAYVYYIRPDLDPIMFDAQWDMMARHYEQEPPRHPLVNKFISENGKLEMFSAYHLKEADYPQWIREKYRDQ